jgi:hypothetical protein
MWKEAVVAYLNAELLNGKAGSFFRYHVALNL